MGVRTRFKIADQDAAAWKRFYSHYADLLIANQPSEDARDKILSGLPENILVSAGAPMIILPRRWNSEQIGRDVVVAWSPSAQAARALHDAMPILARARTVTVFAFDPPSDQKEADIEMLGDHLTAHGIKFEIDCWQHTGDLLAIEAFFSNPAIRAADLVVAGAYSHSLLREALSGGMTRSFLNRFPLPVLLSH